MLVVNENSFKMKGAFFLLGLVALSSAAPQPRKVFHEHFEDFITLIIEEVGDDLDALGQQYVNFDDFLNAFEYLSTQNFRNLVYEMESLPEFTAVTDFLEDHNIDIHYFLDMFNDAIENFPEVPPKRQQASGTDFNSFVRDLTALFPKDKLSALYDQKMEEDDVFRTAMENLHSDEWKELWGALFDSAVFQAEVQTLADIGIDIDVLIDEILAIFGQL